MNGLVVTNLRIPEYRYRKHKALAAEEGLSFNEYVDRMLEEKLNEKQFGISQKKVPKKDFYEAMDKFLDDLHPNEPMGLSEQDKTIYE